MDWALPLAIIAAALGLTYFACLRPMRRGHCAMTPQQRATGTTENAAEIARLRAEVARLREQQRLDTEPAGGAGGRSPANQDG